MNGSNSAFSRRERVRAASSSSGSRKVTDCTVIPEPAYRNPMRNGAGSRRERKCLRTTNKCDEVAPPHRPPLRFRAEQILRKTGDRTRLFDRTMIGVFATNDHEAAF
jgi:hypothetical protein